jgi:hypothetical protein
MTDPFALEADAQMQIMATFENDIADHLFHDGKPFLFLSTDQLPNLLVALQQEQDTARGCSV